MDDLLRGLGMLTVFGFILFVVALIALKIFIAHTAICIFLAFVMILIFASFIGGLRS